MQYLMKHRIGSLQWTAIQQTIVYPDDQLIRTAFAIPASGGCLMVGPRLHTIIRVANANRLRQISHFFGGRGLRIGFLGTTILLHPLAVPVPIRVAALLSIPLRPLRVRQNRSSNIQPRFLGRRRHILRRSRLRRWFFCESLIVSPCTTRNALIGFTASISRI